MNSSFLSCSVSLQCGLDSQGKDCMVGRFQTLGFSFCAHCTGLGINVTHVRRGKTVTRKYLSPNLVILNMVIDFHRPWCGVFCG